MNTVLVLDTHKTIERLKAKGYTQEQAEGFVEAIAESDLITKSYLDQSIHKLRSDIVMWVAGLLFAAVGVLLSVLG